MWKTTFTVLLHVTFVRDLHATALGRLATNRTLLTVFVKSHMAFFNATARSGAFLENYAASSCAHAPREPPARYVRSHVLRSLLIDPDVPDAHWHEYKLVYNKSYSGERHESDSRAAWRDNLQLVASHNRAYLAGGAGAQYALHLNHFADMSPASFVKRVLKLVTGQHVAPGPAHDPRRLALHGAGAGRLPDRVDWRERGFRPRLEEQWRCGACYAFAVAHAAQAQLLRTRRQSPDLSVQQLVDCSAPDGNYGCGGGSLRGALRYVARQGLELEADYPYVGKLGACKYRKWAVRVRAARWALLPAGDEAALARALHAIGPLAVAINAAPRTFQLYRSGVYNDATCVSTHVNHAMLLVGYTRHYWLLLNWWGERWGEGGYMRLRRGVNLCGVANGAAYVELA